MIKQEDVTIIIPHLGETIEQIGALKDCWDSLQETVPDMPKIIASNGRAHIHYLDRQQIHNYQQGQNKAVNAAVATTNTPWIFITNDDMIYAPGWWEKLQTIEGLDGAYNHQGFLCISPKLVEPRSGASTFEVLEAGGAGGDFNKQLFLDYVKNRIPTGITTGFNFPLLIKRELWNLIGGYDINYDPWGSNGDSDLEYKIRLAGVQPYQSQNCIVYHFSQTSGTFNPVNDSYRFRNYAYFKEKWGFDRTDNGIWEANFHMPTREEGRIFTPEWEGRYGKLY